MHTVWKLQDAKAKLSELVKIAANEGPQEISIRGIPQVVVLSKNDYLNLVAPKTNFWSFMQKSPLSGKNICLDRDTSLDRDVKL